MPDALPEIRYSAYVVDGKVKYRKYRLVKRTAKQAKYERFWDEADPIGTRLSIMPPAEWDARPATRSAARTKLLDALQAKVDGRLHGQAAP